MVRGRAGAAGREPGAGTGAIVTDHRSVEVGLPLVRAREEGKLRDTENVAVDVLHALLPHRAGRVIGENLERHAKNVRVRQRVYGRSSVGHLTARRRGKGTYICFVRFSRSAVVSSVLQTKC